MQRNAPSMPWRQNIFVMYSPEMASSINLKVQVILALTLPQNLKQLHHFVDMVQYYRDLCVRHCEMLCSLTNSVWEFGPTKVSHALKTKKEQWYWDSVRQTMFDNLKTTITQDNVPAYPDYPQDSEVYTDNSKSQLGVVTTKTTHYWHFSAWIWRKSSKEQELLVIEETFKEFKCMPRGQCIMLYTDNKNLMKDTLGLILDSV